LGQGTFGKVRLGTHMLTGEKVAIKILEKEKIKDHSDVERVTREIQILKIVRHPNVIQLYEVSLSLTSKIHCRSSRPQNNSF
jgi:5'-AMP-activated protein kinase catalytic alpha subunit